jgi:hypothetical protein
MKYLSFIILSFYSLWGYSWPVDETIETSPPQIREGGTAPFRLNWAAGDTVITPGQTAQEAWLVVADEALPPGDYTLDLQALVQAPAGVRVMASQTTSGPSRCGQDVPVCPLSSVILRRGERCCAEYDYQVNIVTPGQTFVGLTLAGRARWGNRGTPLPDPTPYKFVAGVVRIIVTTG